MVVIAGSKATVGVSSPLGFPIHPLIARSNKRASHASSYHAKMLKEL